MENFAHFSPQVLQPLGRCYMNKQEPKHFCFVGRKLSPLAAIPFFIILQNTTLSQLWNMVRRWGVTILPEFPGCKV